MLAQSSTRYGNFIHFQNDDPIGACLNYYGEWAQQEIDLLATLLKKNSTVIDVGANIGTHTLFFASHCSEGNVLAFEPQQYIYNLLVTNITINNKYNVVPIRAAVSDKTSLIRMKIFSPFGEEKKLNYGEFKINNEAEGGMFTDVVPLDSYSKILSSLDLIKIDVEGMETKVLEGAKGILEKFKPMLYLEFSEKNGNPELIDKLESLGYKSFLHVYSKHNVNNFNKKTTNVWEEENFILTKENMHKRYDASLICFHKDTEIKVDFPEVNRKSSLFDFLFENALI